MIDITITRKRLDNGEAYNVRLVQDDEGKWRMTDPWFADEPIYHQDALSMLRKAGRKDIINQIDPMASFDAVYGG